MTETCLIIGAGQAGLSAAHSLRDLGFGGSIVLTGAEPHLPYQRPPLSKKALTGDLNAERLALKPLAFFETHNIEWRGGVWISDIDVKAGRALHEDGTIAFDHLILATGTAARPLPLASAPKRGVRSLRNLDDAALLRQDMRPGKRIVIIGAGYIGLEVAASAKAQGVEVMILEAAPRVLARVVGEELSRYFEKMHRANGIKLELNARLAAIEERGDGLHVITQDGRHFAADAVLVAIGSQPVTALAGAAGLAVDDGILVDEHCRASHQAVLAAGDCTRFFSRHYGRHVRLESVQNAIDQGRAAAAAITGRPFTYDPVPWFWSDQFDHKLQIAGLSQGYERMILRGVAESRQFSAFYFSGRKLLAVDSINRPRDHMLARRYIGQEIRVDPEHISREEGGPWEELFQDRAA